MAKLTAPLFSLDATGKLADSLIFQSWRGRPYCRRLKNPAATPTPKQIGTRLLVGLCSSIWSTLPQATRDLWELYNPALNMPAFHRFLGFNLDRAARNLPPSLNPTPTGGYAIHDPLSLRLTDNPTHNRLALSAPNVLANPSFNTYVGVQDDNLTDTFTGWTYYHASTGVIESTAASRSGGSACKITRGTDDSLLLYQNVTLEPSTPYTLSLWSHGDGTHSGLFSLYNLTTSAFVIPPTSLGLPSPDWQPFTHDFASQAATNYQLILYCAPAAGAVVHYDHLVLHPTAFPPLADDWAWLIWRTTTPTVPNLVDAAAPPCITANLIAACSAETVFFDDCHLADSTYYRYRAQFVDPDGNISPLTP